MRAILETTSVSKKVKNKEAQAVPNELDHEETERLAYRFWLERGCPTGSPEDDWFRAEDELRHEVSLPLSALAIGPDTSL